ncbi:MAG: acetylxylan esterase [Acidobacteria bacterium]|nr:acetylxylan esterase [Bryobacteraceae bacterium CoA2 C42]
MTKPLSLLLALAASLAGQDFDGWLNQQAQKLLAERRESFAPVRTKAEAVARQQVLREKLLRVIGGLPTYSGPLNPKITGRLEAPTHSIEMVALESLPGYWMTANLYLPKKPGKHPGILFSIGHWNEGKPAAQRIAANLAAQGFVVLAFDPMGQGERIQAYDRRLNRALVPGGVQEHWLAGTQALLVGDTLARYFIWDAKRALDYLVAHPAVDAARIGATGCSGGGTQTTYISALDPRIRVAAPLCYMNSFEVLFPGSIGDSEQSLPNFLSEGLDQTDYVLHFAPKPWLIGSTEEDFFTPAGAKVIYEAARSFYRIFDAESSVKWVVGPGGHGTPKEVRTALYGWFQQWLLGGAGSTAEDPNIRMFTNEELLVLPTGQVATDLKSRDLVELLRERRRENVRPGDLGAEVQRLVRPLAAAPAVKGTEETFTFEPEPGVVVTGHIVRPPGTAKLPGVVHVEAGPALSARAKEIAAAGAVVLAVMPRGLPAPKQFAEYGDWMAATRSWMIGRNLPGMRAQDIAAAVKILAAREDVAPGPIRGVADGTAAVWLLLASAAEPRLGKLWLERAPYNLASALDSPVHKFLHDAVIPGFLRSWDLPDLAKGRTVRWVQPTDWNSNIVKLNGPQYYYRYFVEMNELLFRDYLLR